MKNTVQEINTHPRFSDNKLIIHAREYVHEDGFMALIETNTQTNMGKIARMHTGVRGLDELISGGLPKDSITLVSGPPGSGKSIFCNPKNRARYIG